MTKVKLFFFVLLTSAFLSGFMVGCGGLDEEQMKQLNDLKAEVETLQSNVGKLESEKSDLQKQISAQDQKIKDFQSKVDAMKNCK